MPFCGFSTWKVHVEQLHGHVRMPVARPCLFTLFSYLHFSRAIRQAHGVQALLRSSASVLLAPQAGPIHCFTNASGRKHWRRSTCFFFTNGDCYGMSVTNAHGRGAVLRFADAGATNEAVAAGAARRGVGLSRAGV